MKKTPTSKAKSKAKPAVATKDLKPRKNPKGGYKYTMSDVIVSSAKQK